MAKQTLKTGISTAKWFEALNNSKDDEEMLNLYSQYADEYDIIVKELGFDAPKAEFVEFALQFLKKEHRILDVAAGSGDFGKRIKQQGEYNIDGLDPCKELLDIAKSNKIYNHYFNEYIRHDSRCSIPDESYDVIVSSGGFHPSQITPKELDEVLRMIKTNGILIFYYVSKKTDGFEAFLEEINAKIEELINKSKIKEISSKDKVNMELKYILRFSAFQKL